MEVRRGSENARPRSTSTSISTPRSRPGSKLRRKSRSKSRGRSKSKSRSRSRSKSRSRSRSRSRSKSRGRSRSGSKKRKMRKSRSASTGRGKRGSRKSGNTSRICSAEEIRLNMERTIANAQVRVLMEGESSFISRHVPELEIVLYRPVPEEGKQPLFFDTTACLFNEYGGQIDYVGVGRTTTNNKGLLHRPHAVLIFDATSEVAHNFLEPAGGPSVIAGDSVLVNFKKISMWSGVSVCATLFTADMSLSEVNDVYYAVRKPDALIPLAIVPVTSRDFNRNSCVALMIRKIKLNTETGWELVRVGETLQEQDVKGVVEAMQNRGLVDPVGYKFDTSRSLDYTTEGCSENSSFDDADDDDDDDDDDDAEFVEVQLSRANSKESLERLLINVPRVTREGRRQYTVGRSTINTVVEPGDSSDEDEVMEDALRAVVPRYTSACPVRYEEKTYNVGSRDETLAMHYVDHREEYGLSNAESRLSRTTELPPIFSLSSGHLHRLSYGDTGIIRPVAPHELLSSMYSAFCGKTSLRRRSGRSPSEVRRNSSRRGRRSSSRRPKGRGRRSKSRKSRSRSTSARRKSRRGRRNRRKGTSASRRRKSRTSSAAKRRSSSPSKS